MTKWLNGISLIGILLLPVAYLTWRTQAVPPPIPPLQSVTSSAVSCSYPLQFRTQFQRDVNGLTVQGNQLRFTGFSLATANVCQPGRLIIDAEPQLAGEESPRLTLGINDRSLGEFPVSQRQTFSVSIPVPGRITLGYFNDFYSSEARAATYEKFKLFGTSCQTLKVTATAETGGIYDEASNSAWATSSVPVTIEPCQSGLLTFLVIGRSAENIYPTIQVEQYGKTLQTIKTSKTRQAVQVDVQTGPVTLTLVNPYFKELADRNLIIRSVKFIPNVH